ncbi:MAG TPA: DUF4167 domain-containing protein [Xanthobacteraceae bacterium]|nr:DUF4167 domain-containing protein [Xanthobacteraceae bacterium]
MRNGQNKRMRGRNRKGQNPLTRVYESNGPDVKIRGTPNHVAEKYVQLARDAQASGDPVAAENYFQHAEHYFRLIAAAQEQFRQSHPYFRPEGEQRDDHFDAGEEDASGQPMAGEMPYGGQPQPYPPHPPREAQPYPQQQPYPPRESQHYGRPQPPAQQGRPEGGDPGLPAFITGGGQPQPYQGHGPNGFDGQPDRFPLHRRRRRRHGGPRGDMPGQYGGGGGSEETTPPPSPPGEPSQD